MLIIVQNKSCYTISTPLEQADFSLELILLHYISTPLGQADYSLEYILLHYQHTTRKS